MLRKSSFLGKTTTSGPRANQTGEAVPSCPRKRITVPSFYRFSSIVRVTWSHALALDCIRDILWLQFVQKKHVAWMCVFPPFLGRGRLLSRKHTTNEGRCSFLSVGIIFFFASPHRLRHLVPEYLQIRLF